MKLRENCREQKKEIPIVTTVTIAMTVTYEMFIRDFHPIFA